MNRFSGFAMCMGLGMLAATATPAHAGSPGAPGPASSAAEQGSESATVPTARVKRVGTRLETVIVIAGAVDPQGQRWVDAGARTPVLPTVSESAFLDGDAAALVPTDSQP